MLKVVVDANVFVSIILGGHISEKFLKALFAEEFKLVYSFELLKELREVLSREEFEFRESEIQKILTFIERKGVLVFPLEKISVCRDIEDNKLLECAVSGDVDLIVTGDNDLLVLSPFRNISIITPAKFLKLL